MYRLAQGGPGWQPQGGLPPGWHLPTSPSRGRFFSGPGPRPCGFGAQVLQVDGIFFISFDLRFDELRILHSFYVFSCISPAKLINTKTRGNL